MAQTTNTTQNNEDYINKMYDSSLESQKAQLGAAFAQGNADLDAQKEANEKAANSALAQTYVDAQKQQRNYAEVQNAYGLTSGAMAQARLAQNNQLQSDMTTIRATQQEADAQIERQRGILAQQYAQAIAEAQSNNDLSRAQALYEEAQRQDAALLQRQREAAALMAEAGDYSLYQILYGLSDDQMAVLNGGQTPQPEVNPEVAPEAGPQGDNGIIGYEDTNWDPTQEPTGVDVASLDGMGYAEFPEDAIAILVSAGMLEEYVENGVVRWRLGDNNKTETGEAKYSPRDALAQAVVWTERNRR